MNERTHLIAISTFANIINISFAFILYKIFVFKTRGGWIHEYFRAYLTYGVAAVLGTMLVWLMVDFLNIAFWVAQAAVMSGTIVLSFFLHKNFTFASSDKSHD